MQILYYSVLLTALYNHLQALYSFNAKYQITGWSFHYDGKLPGWLANTLPDEMPPRAGLILPEILVLAGLHSVLRFLQG